MSSGENNCRELPPLSGSRDTSHLKYLQLAVLLLGQAKKTRPSFGPGVDTVLRLVRLPHWHKGGVTFIAVWGEPKPLDFPLPFLLSIDLDVLVLNQSTLLGVLNSDDEDGCDIWSMGVLFSARVLHSPLLGEIGVDVLASLGVLCARPDIGTGGVDEDEACWKDSMDGENSWFIFTAKLLLLEAAGGLTTLDNDWGLPDFPRQVLLASMMAVRELVTGDTVFWLVARRVMGCTWLTGPGRYGVICLGVALFPDACSFCIVHCSLLGALPGALMHLCLPLVAALAVPFRGSWFVMKRVLFLRWDRQSRGASFSINPSTGMSKSWDCKTNLSAVWVELLLADAEQLSAGHECCWYTWPTLECVQCSSFPAVRLVVGGKDTDEDEAVVQLVTDGDGAITRGGLTTGTLGWLRQLNN